MTENATNDRRIEFRTGRMEEQEDVPRLSTNR